MLLWGFLPHFLALSNPFQFPIASTPRRPGPGPGSSVQLHQALGEQDRWTSFSQTSVALPHENPTKSFWTHGTEDANPLAKEGSKGPLTTDADIVIIGSGITGVGTAYHLSGLAGAENLPLSVLILEARDFCEDHT